MNTPLRETIAAVQHDIWINWMRYLFECSVPIENGAVIIPKEKVKRWKRLMGLPYHLLSDKEQESDRHQADKVMAKLK